jgi:hypothetical protein
MTDLATDGLYTIHRRMHRLLATVADRAMIIDAANHHVHLMQQPDGSIGLPTLEQVREMLASGVMRPIHSNSASGTVQERRRILLDMMDAAGIRNGVKSIAIFLHAVWDEDLRRRYGDHDEPATIRKWRTARRKALKAIERMERSDA